jgi:hypothetical protein
MLNSLHHRALRRTIVISLSLLTVAGCGLVPKTSLTAADIPLGPGTSYVAYQNKTTIDGAAVKFDPQGPWDFTATGDDAVVKSSLIKVGQAANHNLFPGATYAEKVLPSDFTGGFTSYNFGGESDAALFVFGQSVTPADNGTKIKRYERPERLLVFPLVVGKSWSDVITVKDGVTTTFDVVRKVLARGEVKTAAGTFTDCFLVRSIRQMREPGAAATRTVIYTWWAPGVGPVAAIGGQPGEKSLILTQADYMFRLKTYKIVN